jgi:hypothetical protein
MEQRRSRVHCLGTDPTLTADTSLQLVTTAVTESPVLW